jgi:dihydroorotate dehydrogenase
MTLLHSLATRALRILEPEEAHRLTVKALKAGWGPRPRPPIDPFLETRLGTLRLPNPIGLAAGFDKNAETPGAMLAAGFGFVECGTVTPRPQPGNPPPRLFRLEEDRAVINRLGFNNEGVDAVGARLAAGRPSGIIGANVGANKDSTDRAGDYVTGLRRLWRLADYFTLNVSSPNTPRLRDLQLGGALEDLLGRVAEARWDLAYDGDRPIFLKVAPDLAEADVDTIVEAAKRFGLQGLIVGNTTLARPSLASVRRDEAGGLSGAPLMGPSTHLLRLFHQATGGRLGRRRLREDPSRGQRRTALYIADLSWAGPGHPHPARPRRKVEGRRLLQRRQRRRRAMTGSIADMASLH